MGGVGKLGRLPAAERGGEARAPLSGRELGGVKPPWLLTREPPTLGLLLTLLLPGMGRGDRAGVVTSLIE